MGLSKRAGATLLLLVLIAAGLGLFTLQLLGKLPTFHPRLAPGCEAKPNPDPTWPPPLIIVAALGSFTVGRFLAYPRTLRTRTPNPKGPEVVVQFVFTVFLGLVSALLLYETVSLADTSHLAPITFYVRCAGSYAHVTTFVATCAVSLLAGHWLWFVRR